MKVVKVDGTLFLGDVVEGKVVNALALSGATLGTELSITVFANYLMAKNLGELMEMAFGTTSAFASRDLNVMEKHAFGNAEFSMGISKELAVRDLENMYFGKLVKGK
jgi:hypothetical protein